MRRFKFGWRSRPFKFVGRRGSIVLFEDLILFFVRFPFCAGVVPLVVGCLVSFVNDEPVPVLLEYSLDLVVKELQDLVVNGGLIVLEEEVRVVRFIRVLLDQLLVAVHIKLVGHSVVRLLLGV